MGAVSSASSVDAVVLVPSRFSLGFVKAVDNSHLPPADSEGVLLSEEAFGHIGFGGSIGFADPRARLSFALHDEPAGRRASASTSAARRWSTRRTPPSDIAGRPAVVCGSKLITEARRARR